jgi:hypothetical protein
MRTIAADWALTHMRELLVSGHSVAIGQPVTGVLRVARPGAISGIARYLSSKRKVQTGSEAIQPPI